MPKVNLMRVFGVICAAALVLVTAVSYISWQVNDIEDSVLRLHIVANSDSDEDQALKLKVRDEVVDRCGFLFENCVSAEQSIKTAADNIGFIKYVAEQVITENGYNYDADCQVTQCSFPTKQYERPGDSVVSLPRGEYNALNIKIGAAKGKNWWCVMFPPLCFVDEQKGIIDKDTDDKLREVLTEEEYELISQKTSKQVDRVQIKFKIVEIIQDIIK